MKPPKEEAEELVGKYFKYSDHNIQCALIAVDKEIYDLMIICLLCNFDNPMKPILENKIRELQEVKQEINNL